MTALPKICPSCGAEYQPWVDQCKDCGCALEHPSTAPAPAASAVPRGPELPPAHELVCLRVGDPWLVREAAEALSDAGIACRVDVYPPAGTAVASEQRSTGLASRLGLYVRPQDAEVAARVEHEHQLLRTPDAPPDLTAPGQALDACPACGASLAETAESCGECGLEFPPAGEAG